jgi:hypothetical protein
MKDGFNTTNTLGAFILMLNGKKQEEPFRIVVPICRIGGLNEADKLIPMKQSPKVSLLTSNFIPCAAASSTRKSGHLLARPRVRWFLPEE